MHTVKHEIFAVQNFHMTIWKEAHFWWHKTFANRSHFKKALRKTNIRVHENFASCWHSRNSQNFCPREHFML